MLAKPRPSGEICVGDAVSRDHQVVLATVIIKVMEDFQTGEETSFAVDEVSGIIKDVRNEIFVSSA